MSLQMVKAICAFMVVQQHCRSWLGSYAVAFHTATVPLFLMISGYFLLDKNGELTTKRLAHAIKKMLIITIAANAFYILFWTILAKFDATWPKQDITLRIVIVRIANGNIGWFHLWYLSTALETLIVFYMLARYRLIKLAMPLAFIGLVISFIFGFSDTFTLPSSYNVREFLILGIPFMYMGMLVRLNEHRITASALTILYFMPLVLGLGYLEDYVRDGIIVMRPIIATTLFIFAIRLHPKHNIIAEIGRKHSANIYILHPFFSYLLGTTMGNWLALTATALSILASATMHRIAALAMHMPGHRRRYL